MKLKHLGLFGIISLLSYTAMVVFSPLAYPGYNWLSMAVSTGSFFPKDAWISFGENAVLLLFFNLGVLFYLIRMGRNIRKGVFNGKKYTRILIPSFVFILFADIFFVIVSLFEGGLFRGWLAREDCENTER